MTLPSILGSGSRAFTMLLSAALLVTGCGDDDTGAGGAGGADSTGSTGASDATGSSVAESATSTSTGGAAPSADELFSERAKGEWLLQFTVEGENGAAYVDDYDTFDPSTHTMVLHVEVFADEARTFLLLTYDASFDYEIIGLSSALPDVFEIDIENVEASMTARVDPAALAGFGIDDCNLVLDEAVDISKSDCALPSFRDGSCKELDIYEVAEGSEEMYPALGLESRCEVRPTAINRDLTRRRSKSRVATAST